MTLSEKSCISRHLEETVIAYWHDVDFNWGRNAATHYTTDAEFISPRVRYAGRDQIREFYAWRKERGERVNVHLVANFHLKSLSGVRAEVAWICLLYAHDGEAPQPSAPPIAISRVEDIFVNKESEWLCRRRNWHSLFRGGVPTTGIGPEEMERRLSTKVR